MCSSDFSIPNTFLSLDLGLIKDVFLLAQVREGQSPGARGKERSFADVQLASLFRLISGDKQFSASSVRPRMGIWGVCLSLVIGTQRDSCESYMIHRKQWFSAVFQNTKKSLF